VPSELIADAVSDDHGRDGDHQHGPAAYLASADEDSAKQQSGFPRDHQAQQEGRLATGE